MKMRQNEIWKDIPGYEGRYQVSTLGNVKSLDRVTFYSDGRVGKFKGQLLNPSIANGYRVTRIENKTYKCSKLVAMAFLGHRPCGYNEVVDHINNISSDDRLENLQLISVRENVSKDRRGTSKYTGVSWDKSRNKWICMARIDGKQKNLGRYDTEIEAYNVYKKAVNT